MTVTPENVTITGAQSTLDQIDQAVAVVDINGISEDEVRTADLYLYGADGNIIGQNQLENNLGEEGITVSIEVLKIKTVSDNCRSIRDSRRRIPIYRMYGRAGEHTDLRKKRCDQRHK